MLIREKIAQTTKILLKSKWAARYEPKNGPNAIPSVELNEKILIPSPWRPFGIIANTIVCIAVVTIPKVAPWIKRTTNKRLNWYAEKYNREAIKNNSKLP